MCIIDQLVETLAGIAASDQYCIAYSGGLDSSVLLQAMHNVAKQKPFQLRAVHINHGLHPKADDLETHCRQVCADLMIPFDAYKIDVDTSTGDSIEAVARQGRYQLFSEMVKNNENLVTAHTKNDQAETVLLQLMRGSGVKGLSAMPLKKSFFKGFLIRPLLHHTREELCHYATENNLQWIEDDSNSDERFDRNYVRHQMMPIVQQRWPEALTTLSRAAEHCAEATQLLDQLAEMDFQSVKSELKNELLIEPLKQYPVDRQRNIVRYWIHINGYRMPNTKQLGKILDDVLPVASDAVPCVVWDNTEIRRFQQRLMIMPCLSAHDATQVIPWDFQQSLLLSPEMGTLMVEKIKGEGIRLDIDVHKISVRFRRGGERIRPVGRKETHTLKHLLQEWQVPPWQRDRVPLIYYNDELIAVVGYCVADQYAAPVDEIGFFVS